MVAFLLQTTSSEDLCGQGTSWPNRHTGPPHAVLQGQQILSRAPGDGAPASLQPPTATTVLELLQRRRQLQLQDLFSVAHTTTRSSASEDTAQEDPMSTVNAVTSSALRPFQHLPRVPSNSAVSVTHYNPQFSK
jgi:hypothetical protein